MMGCLCPLCDGFWPDRDGNYRVGICGTCHDDIARAYHSCCVEASEDEQDALLLVGYTYGSLHGTRDCQALMARSYDNGNPFQIIREDSKYHFGSSPTYGGNYTFTAKLRKCKTSIKVVLDDGARKVYGPPRPNYRAHTMGENTASGGNHFLNVQNTSVPFAEQAGERRIQDGQLVTWNEFVDNCRAHGIFTLLQLHDYWLTLPLPPYQ